MTVGAVVLAAGSSSRLGSPKQVVRFHGETLLDRAVRMACTAGCVPVLVVLGAHEAEIRQQCSLEGATVIANTRWAEGMGTSLATGINALRGVLGAIVMTCDMPAVTADHLRALMRSGDLTASCYAGRSGVPAFFPCRCFPALASLQGDTGAREMLQSAAHIELQYGELDVDTAADLEELHRMPIARKSLEL